MIAAMGDLHINCLCSGGCKTILPVAFDSDVETCGDLKRELVKAGWRVEGGPGSHGQRLTCPKCAAPSDTLGT